MSAKYELDGYRPLRPWQRGVSYLGFIIVGVLAYLRIQPGFPPLMTMLFQLALVLTACCTLVSFWDARVTASLRRKGVRKVRVVPGFAQPPLTFFEREDEWDYFSDSTPELARSSTS